MTQTQANDHSLKCLAARWLTVSAMALRRTVSRISCLGCGHHSRLRVGLLQLVSCCKATRGYDMDALRVAITAIAGSFLAALGYGFGPWPPNNIMLAAEILGVPVWLECFAMALALFLVCALSAAQMLQRARQA